MPQSRVYLPKVESPPATILEHLAARFPHIPASTWRDRMARGLVTSSDGAILREDSPYRHGMTVFYAKEVPSEPAPLEVETILYQDDEILIADKPHGMTVTPGGQHVARSLLNRLQEQTGIADLVPLHRLDRDTAGIVLFSSRAGSRGRYHHALLEQGLSSGNTSPSLPWWKLRGTGIGFSKTDWSQAYRGFAGTLKATVP